MYCFGSKESKKEKTITRHKKAAMHTSDPKKPEIDKLQSQLGYELPGEYKRLLLSLKSEQRTDGLTIYPLEDVVERNETFDVTSYWPEFLLIGDDSGGTGILITTDSADPPVFYSGLGDLTLPFQAVSTSLSAWIYDNHISRADDSNPERLPDPPTKSNFPPDSP